MPYVKETKNALKTDAQFKVLENLLKIQCTPREICAVLEISDDTLKRRIVGKYDCTLEDLSEHFRHHGRASLRRKMYDNAFNNNSQRMQIHLSKQKAFLDMPDRVEGSYEQLIGICNELEDKKKEQVQ